MRPESAPECGEGSRPAPSPPHAGLAREIGRLLAPGVAYRFALFAPVGGMRVGRRPSSGRRAIAS